MDFSDNIFRDSTPLARPSNDTMSHANLVMACQWSWTRAHPDPSTSSPSAQTPFGTSLGPPQPIAATTSNNVRTKRFAPCQGRLYHQLLCSHRIRTDLVEDCGENCVEPYGNTISTAFICNACLDAEATGIWEARKAEHNKTYPTIDQMSKEQYLQYYEEHRLLERNFARDRKLYETELRAKLRPSNMCSTLETSKEEMDFATELDSLSLSLMTSNTSVNGQNLPQAQGRGRLSLPNDAVEQLHWNLGTLALDPRSCGIESSPPPATGIGPSLYMNEEELWKHPRR